jgi:hypothetical protein
VLSHRTFISSKAIPATFVQYRQKSGCLQIKQEGEGKYGFRLADAALRRDSHGMKPTRFCERPTFNEPIATRANECHQSEIRP